MAPDTPEPDIGEQNSVPHNEYRKTHLNQYWKWALWNPLVLKIKNYLRIPIQSSSVQPKRPLCFFTAHKLSLHSKIYYRLSKLIIDYTLIDWLNDWWKGISFLPKEGNRICLSLTKKCQILFFRLCIRESTRSSIEGRSLCS